MMAWYLAAAVTAAGVDWWALNRENKKIGNFTKPAVILCLILGVWVNMDISPGGMPFWFLIGLVFSLAGDIVFLLPGDRFLAGLSLFLGTHIAYIIGFDVTPIPDDVTGAAAFLGVLVAVFSGWAVSIFWRAARSSENAKMAYAVILYILVLGGMLYAGLFRFIDPVWNGAAAYLSAFGALAFGFSDLVLGLNRFVKKIDRAKQKIRIYYQLGQLGIIAGMWLAAFAA
ncbi:MAG: lysoplasmalogenase [Anaerolineae bacterium]|nr:lysoplasmalogenase [Anaerolineae bacterium]